MGYRRRCYPPWIDERLKLLRERLQMYYDRESEILGAEGKSGVKSYKIGSRSAERYDTALNDIWKTIKALEKEIAELEAMKRGGSARKAVGVLPRDW